MQLCPLSAVKQRFSLGTPLPFDVRDGNRTLLLASGQVIENDEQMQALFERGALVDLDELLHPGDLREAAAEALPAIWQKSMDRVGSVLKASVQRGFAGALEEAAKPMLALIDRDPDLAIFQIVRQDPERRPQYGVTHSMHTAIASLLAARRLGWEPARKQLLFKAALTMNLGMIELQGRLAMQVTPLSPGQRAAIRDHPTRSMEMLRAAGVEDPLWLDAVAHHHETPDGDGYPNRLQEVGELASLLRRADIYTAKLSPRATRAALPANQAARTMFLQDNGHPMSAALVKEFGVYPPGCCVRLASGELGLVVKRGETANAPIVAALTDRHGDAMLEPVRRHTGSADHAIVEVIDEKLLRVRVSPEQLARV